MQREMEKKIVKITPDGNCLFRAISYCLVKNQDIYNEVRHDIVSYVTRHWNEFKDYVLGDQSYGSLLSSKDDYESHMVRNSVYGGSVELRAAVELYQIGLSVYSPEHSVHNEFGSNYSRKFTLIFTGNGDHGHYNVLEKVEQSKVGLISVLTAERKRAAKTITQRKYRARKRANENSVISDNSIDKFEKKPVESRVENTSYRGVSVKCKRVAETGENTVNHRDTGEAAMFESEEFEVVDECVEEDESALAKGSPKSSATKSAVKTEKTEKLEPIQNSSKGADATKDKDKIEVPKKTEAIQNKNISVGQPQQKQHATRIQKPIDFTADISMDQLNAPGEYMTDEEILNNLDELENIDLDGTSFELQDDADQSSSTLNVSENDAQIKKPAAEEGQGKTEVKNSEDVKKVGTEKDAKTNPDDDKTKGEEPKPEEEQKIETKNSDTDWYEKKLQTKVTTVKERLSKLARVLELSYPRYKGWLDRNEAINGTPICRLDEPRRCPLEKPHTNRWKFVCSTKPVQESTEKQNTNKEESSGNSDSTVWRLTPTGVWDSNTDNSSEYPPFVMKAVKVFEDFLQTTPSVDESSSQPANEATTDSGETASKAEEITPRSDTDDKETAKQEWLWLLVRCNRLDELMLFATGRNIDRTTMDSLKQVYEVGAGKDCKVKSLYCKSIIKTGTTISNTTTFLFGSEALDEIVGGIKIQLAPKTNFWSNAAGAESLGNAVANLLSPTPKTTVVEIGCGTGLIGLMLASKCHQVIGLDSPSEVEEAEMTSELNGVKNASFVMGEPAAVMATIAKVLSNCKAVAIVNTNTNIGRAIEVMTDLRKILALKRLVMVTTLTKQSVRSILELTRPGDHILGNPFIPIRACVVDTLPIGPHFEVVILMERRMINKFPRHWVNPSTSTPLRQPISAGDKEAVGSSAQGASGALKKDKLALNRVPKIIEPPVKKGIEKLEPPPKKAKFIPGFNKKAQFLASKQLKDVPPLPPPKNKFKTKRFHSPDRPHVPPKKFANRFDKGNTKPWAVPRTSPEQKLHEDRRPMNKFDDQPKRNLQYRNRSPLIMKDELERRKTRSWSRENPAHLASPNRDKRFRDHKDQSDLRERLSGNRIEPEIMEKVKKQQQMLDMAKQKLSGQPSSVDVATAKQLQSMLNMVLEETSKLQSQLPLSVWDRIAPPENVPSSSGTQSQNNPVFKGRYIQEMGTQDIVIMAPNREFMKPNEQSSRGSYDRFNNIPPSRNTLMASSSRPESGSDRFQNMMPDRYHRPSNDYHKQQEQESQWNREKQLDKGRWEPFSQLKKGSPPVRKPMTPPRHHMSGTSPRRGGSPLRRPLSPPRRQISPQRRHISPSRRQISPLRRQNSPSRRQMSPSRRQMSPRHQISPSRRQISPQRRAMSPPRHGLSPSRRHMSPTRHQLTPSRRVDDDWDIPSRGAVEQNTWQRPNERMPEKRWHEERQPPAPSNWDHSGNNERYRKSVNQDKWDIKDASHDAIWKSASGGDSWEPKQPAVPPNKEHWQSAPENRWPISSGGSNGDNWNIRGKETFPKPSTREESKSVWAEQANKPRWGESGGPAKESWGQADKDDWNDLPDDAKDPWGDDGNNVSKDRWPKYDNNPGPSGWSRENQTGDTWTKPGDSWQSKSASGNKPQWQSSPAGQVMGESRWTSNEGTKKASMSGGGWQGSGSGNNSWSSQNYPGFQQSRSYNPGSFKDRR